MEVCASHSEAGERPPVVVHKPYAATCVRTVQDRRRRRTTATHGQDQAIGISEVRAAPGSDVLGHRMLGCLSDEPSRRFCLCLTDWKCSFKSSCTRTNG